MQPSDACHTEERNELILLRRQLDAVVAQHPKHEKLEGKPTEQVHGEGGASNVSASNLCRSHIRRATVLLMVERVRA